MDRLKQLLSSRSFEYFITAVIAINAITLGLETSETVMNSVGPLLHMLDRIALGIFIVEILARLLVYRLSFFRDPWNIFDFVIVSIALAPATASSSILRALRILRVLRLLSFVPTLKRVVGALVSALPGMGSIILLMTLIFYVFAVMATQLYSNSFPDWFGTIGHSAYTLFQVMTLESWSMGIVRPVMETYPFAWAFFVPFILATTFTMLNLFIGIIVKAMQSEHEAEADAERQAIQEETENMTSALKDLKREVVELRAEIRLLKQPDPKP
ncbi:ion transporter [Coralliovum pocilloporae]|uniref:ion transporter n=1 Tax=Coralliovum pocilloporae TaxID=3066369 RepID=UPI003307091F